MNTAAQDYVRITAHLIPQMHIGDSGAYKKAEVISSQNLKIFHS